LLDGLTENSSSSDNINQEEMMNPKKNVLVHITGSCNASLSLLMITERFLFHQSEKKPFFFSLKTLFDT
jgi:hypothetical protein